MAIKRTSDCSGCAECIRCGMDAPRMAVFCDKCRQEIDSTVYLTDGGQLCDTCALRTLRSCDVEELLDDTP